MSLSAAERHLSFYRPDTGELQEALDKLLPNGPKRLLLAPAADDAVRLKTSLTARHPGLICDLCPEDDEYYLIEHLNDYEAVILFLTGNPDRLNDLMLACLDLKKGHVLAPITDDHYLNRSVFLVSIPKAGTHLVTGLLNSFGFSRERRPILGPGCWGTLPGGYHNPCREFFLREWGPDPLEAHQFFRSGALFVYRNPLDILASEFSWYQFPQHAFSHLLSTAGDDDGKLMRLIEDDRVMGSIRDRIFRYIGWLDFANVIPVSYEELAGSPGGGSDEEQAQTIWSLQLKLHVPGNPNCLAQKVYNRQSPTFFKGAIGRHRDYFKEIHFQRFKKLASDVMDRLGYRMGGEPQSSRVDFFRRRPVRFWRPSANQKELWFPRLQREVFFNHNIVAAAGQYMVVPTSLGEVDLTADSGRSQPGIHTGLGSQEEAMCLAATLPLKSGLDDLKSELSGIRQREKKKKEQMARRDDLNPIWQRLKEAEQRLEILDSFEQRISGMEQRLDALDSFEQRLGRAEQRLEAVDTRANDIEAQTGVLTSLRHKVDSLEEWLVEISKRCGLTTRLITSLERTIGRWLGFKPGIKRQ